MVNQNEETNDYTDTKVMEEKPVLSQTSESEDDRTCRNGEIRIKINKNKRILNNLAKFTKDLTSALGKNEGMTLLYYDFNGTKSSLSVRS